MMIKKRLNSKIKIDGILFTMVNSRSVFHREMQTLLSQSYSSDINIFKTTIPASVRVAETTATGQSIYEYEKNGKVAQAYKEFTNEVKEIQ